MRRERRIDADHLRIRLRSERQGKPFERVAADGRLLVGAACRASSSSRDAKGQ